jgi:hypothetical protein
MDADEWEKRATATSTATADTDFTEKGIKKKKKLGNYSLFRCVSWPFAVSRSLLP